MNDTKVSHIVRDHERLRTATIVLLWAVTQNVLALEPPPTPAQLREWSYSQ
jgi:hypothetical protein